MVLSLFFCSFTAHCVTDGVSPGLPAGDAGYEGDSDGKGPSSGFRTEAGDR